MKKNKGFIPYDYEAIFTQKLEELHELFAGLMIKNKYKCVYALKEIRAGEQLEIEIYPEFFKKSDIPPEGRIKRDNSRAQKNLNDKNARKYVERLINENFKTHRDIWATFTYADGQEPGSMKEAIKNMGNFIRRINKKRKKRGLPNARYVYIIEYNPEDKIRWHHHLIIDGELPMDILEAEWKKGNRNNVRKIDKDEYGLAGIAHYITKDKHRKKSQRRWNCSKNLKKPHIRKVYSKPLNKKGNYRGIKRFVDEFVKDHQKIRTQVEKWYPEYIFTDSGVYYNDFNGLFYVKARMRKEGG